MKALWGTSPEWRHARKAGRCADDHACRAPRTRPDGQSTLSVDGRCALPADVAFTAVFRRDCHGGDTGPVVGRFTGWRACATWSRLYGFRARLPTPSTRLASSPPPGPFFHLTP